MPGRQRDDQIAMNAASRARRHDQAAIRRAREGRDGALDLAASRTLTGLYFHPERRRHGLDDAKLPSPADVAASRRTAARVTPGAISLSSSSHFPLRLNSKDMKPVTLPPGRAKLSTKPAPTGSRDRRNTIGTVRVACSNGRHGRRCQGPE